MRPILPILLALALTAPGSRAAPSGTPGATLAASGPASDTSRVRLGPEQGGTTAFVAWPAGRGPAPAVIVAHEWWGLNAQIRGLARRLAREGYVAIVPDLHRGQLAEEAERAHELSRVLDEEQAVGDLVRAMAWLRAQPRVRRDRIGAVGFSMGGRLVQLLALRHRELAGAVMFYGRPETDAETLAQLTVPLQGHFGGSDRGISREQVEALKTGLARSALPADIYLYPGAGHAFMHEGGGSYHADAARQAWARTLQFLQIHLKD